MAHLDHGPFGNIPLFAGMVCVCKSNNYSQKNPPPKLWMVHSCASAEPTSASDWTLSQLLSM